MKLYNWAHHRPLAFPREWLRSFERSNFLSWQLKSAITLAIIQLRKKVYVVKSEKSGDDAKWFTALLTFVVKRKKTEPKCYQILSFT